ASPPACASRCGRRSGRWTCPTPLRWPPTKRGASWATTAECEWGRSARLGRAALARQRKFFRWHCELPCPLCGLAGPARTVSCPLSTVTALFCPVRGAFGSVREPSAERERRYPGRGEVLIGAVLQDRSGGAN